MTSPAGQDPRRRAIEARLDALKEEAQRTGRVAGTTTTTTAIAGGPIPREGHAQSANGPTSSYYGQPILKRPVWTWQVGLYFFIGGTAGMSAVLAFAGVLTGQSPAFVVTALDLAVAGAVLSPCLLIWDLGRPARFLNMLRVFKWRSAMSMGVWTLVIFSSCAGAAWLLARTEGGVASPLRATGLLLCVLLAAVFGAVLATYTGVLLGATAIPAWSSHHRLLPVHFGIVALGSAAAVMELLGFRVGPLNAIGLIVAAVETGIGAWVELHRTPLTMHALRRGRAGVLLRTAGVLTGPTSFVFRLAGAVPFAALSLLLGALVSRYGWLAAGAADE